MEGNGRRAFGLLSVLPPQTEAKGESLLRRRARLRVAGTRPGADRDGAAARSRARGRVAVGLQTVSQSIQMGH